MVWPLSVCLFSLSSMTCLKNTRKGSVSGVEGRSRKCWEMRLDRLAGDRSGRALKSMVIGTLWSILNRGVKGADL